MLSTSNARWKLTLPTNSKTQHMARIKVNPLAIVIYCRVSTEEQGKSHLGLDAQLSACQRLSEYEGLEVIETFCEVISGKIDPMARPVFTTAIATAQQHGARLMVAKLDRLSRDVYHISSFINGYMVKNCPKLIIAENPNAGEFELNLRASLAQEERRLISERTKAALAVKRSQGCELGKVGRETVTESRRAATLQAFEIAQKLRADGKSLDAIAQHLNELGLTTSRGSVWTRQALHKRLKTV
ncbi:recombinase family protein [Anabaena sp. PCC 7108]|uniref:recombinase family protein n=1 Tax=Anabaena sp. PCC 7108 TaxID=163908 RepID=UPI000A0678ED|nr:recombinase family protein [Anabaena sp. PCC 7108]